MSNLHGSERKRNFFFVDAVHRLRLAVPRRMGVELPGLLLFALSCFGAGAGPAHCSTLPDSAIRYERRGDVVFVTNRTITVGVDLAKGGSIVHLSGQNGRNLVNDHDLGRQIQASFYSGPKPYGQPAPQWQGWNWNPIQSGDVHGNGAQVAAWKVEGTTIYTRVRPYQWALRKVRCECIFETWLRLDGRSVHMRTRMNNDRPDHTQYPATTQELPAVYTVGALRHLVSYTGSAPFTGAAVTALPTRFPWTDWLATEGWSAYLDDDGMGLGVISPSAQTFAGGFSGPLRDGDAQADQTGYIAPLLKEILDHNIRYSSEATLVVGTLADIRAAAQAAVTQQTRPDYLFATDRQHWWYLNGHDEGWPIRGGLRFVADGEDPQMFAPKRAFSADSVPVLHMSAVFTGPQRTAQLFWTTYSDSGFNEAHSMRFEVQPDGKAHSYSLNMSEQPSWSGIITGLRFDPPGVGNGPAIVCSLSWRKHACPADIGKSLLAKP